MKVLAFVSEHSRVIGAWVALGLACLFDIFTVHGFLFALYLEPAGDLVAPTVTRVTWVLIFYVVGSASVQRLMWREGALYFDNHIQLWAASHVDVVKRLRRRLAWWVAGITVAVAQHRKHRPATVVLDGVLDVSSPVPDTVQAAPFPTPAAA